MLFAPDTDPRTRAFLLRRLRAMTPADRFAATADLVRLGLELARSHAGPAAGGRRLRFLERWLGRELARAVFAEEQRRSLAAP
jgi:hypothetical protein